jgi:hypothetical protein
VEIRMSCSPAGARLGEPNVNWTARPDGDHGRFEVMIVTEDSLGRLLGRTQAGVADSAAMVTAPPRWVFECMRAGAGGRRLRLFASLLAQPPGDRDCMTPRQLESLCEIWNSSRG